MGGKKHLPYDTRWVQQPKILLRLKRALLKYIYRQVKGKGYGK